MTMSSSMPAVGETGPIEDPQASADVPVARTRSRVPNWLRILWQNRKARVGLVMLVIFALVGIFAPVLAPYDPHSTQFESGLNATSGHWLGTTNAGEDVFSQMIWGTRTSLIVGVLAGFIVSLIALVIGLVAGYTGGIVDDVLGFFINLALVIPIFPLIALAAVYSPVRGILPIIIILGITGWAGGARQKRSQILTLRNREYVTAAVMAGDGTWRIIFREILPNMFSLVVAAYMGAATGAIGAEAGLAFLGLGDPNTISWGTMTYWANNSGALLTGQWLWLLAPGVMIALLMTSLTLINFGVDALSNPHLREE